MDNRMEGKNFEAELNSIEEDIKSMTTGSGEALSSAASTGYGLWVGDLRPAIILRGQVAR